MVNLDFRQWTQDDKIEDFYIVGQATGQQGETEFIFFRYWTYADIAQTALLFLIAITFIFKTVWTIFRKQSSFLN